MARRDALAGHAEASAGVGTNDQLAGGDRNPLAAEFKLHAAVIPIGV